MIADVYKFTQFQVQCSICQHYSKRTMIFFTAQARLPPGLEKHVITPDLSDKLSDHALSKRDVVDIKTARDHKESLIKCKFRVKHNTFAQGTLAHVLNYVRMKK